MSNPTPANPLPVTPSTKPMDWAKLVTMIVGVLTALGILFNDTVVEPTKPESPPVVAPVDPAPGPPRPPVVVAPEPTKPPVVVPPVAAPESWIIIDTSKTPPVRISNAALEKLAGELKPGKYIARGIPKPGQSEILLTITIDDGVPVAPPVVVDPPKPPVVDPPPVTVKATAATYVYEKDSGGVPSAVMAGLNELNRKKVLATVLEDDPDDGTGDVPEQYKVSLAAARTAGLPALVVTAGNVVVKVAKDPKTKEAVTEAVQ